MTTQARFLVLISAILTVLANLLMRYGLLSSGGISLSPSGIIGEIIKLFHHPAFAIGILSYGLSAIIWFKVLSIAEVSTSYPILVGLTFVMVTAGAVPLFHETLNLTKIIGIVIILIGIIIVAYS